MASRPVILLVDDDGEALSALRRALARRFGADYDVRAHTSASHALSDLARLETAGTPVALVIADHWMPEMNGRTFLGRARERAPDAKRGLLVAWGDRTSAPAILQGCAFGELDNYLLKPWAPAEVHLYPVVSEFLAEWTRDHGPRMEFVRVVGREPSARGHEIRELLERSSIPHGCYAAESPDGRRLLEQTGLTDAPTGWLEGVLQRDRQGFILTGAELNASAGGWELDRPPARFETSLPGVFAAGDVRKGSTKRVASAVGEGAVVMEFVHEYLASPAAVSPWLALAQACPLPRPDGAEAR